MSHSRRKFSSLLMLAAAFLLQPRPGHADDFYKGKTVRIVVGYTGGGYDLYARLLSRFLGQHIPGSPNVVVENMDGAGGIRAANDVASTEPKDGTVIAAMDQSVPIRQVMGYEGARFEAKQLQWVGAIAYSNALFYTWHTSGITTIEDAKKTEVIAGASITTNDSYRMPLIVNGLIGTKFKVVAGYGDSGRLALAMESGEIAARGGNSWASLSSSQPEWLADKKINIILQLGKGKEPDLPNVPLLADLVIAPEARQIADLITVPTTIGDAYWVAPGVPTDRLAILRAAFDATVKDPALIAEAGRAKMMVRPRAGAEIQSEVERVAATPHAVIQRTLDMIDAKK